jgi:hypothetical protein
MLRNMSEAHFSLDYKGEALHNGLMDVRDLAPSLLAIGQLLEEVNTQVNGHESAVSVCVAADFERGSFGVDLTAFQDMLCKAKGLFSPDAVKNAEDLAKIAGLIGNGGKNAYLGVIALKKWLKGRNPEKQTELEDGRVKVQFKAEAEFTTKDVLALLNNDRASRAIDKITAPLEKDGIDSLSVKEAKTGKVIETITKQDRKFLQAAPAPALELSAPSAEDGRLVSRRRTLLRLSRISFKRGNKYSVVEGESEFSVSVEDEVFLGRVERDEVKFSAHGKLLVDLRQEIIPGATKDAVEHIIEEVLDYIEPAPPPTQIPLQPES